MIMEMDERRAKNRTGKNKSKWNRNEMKTVTKITYYGKCERKRKMSEFHMIKMIIIVKCTHKTESQLFPAGFYSARCISIGNEL